MVIASLQSKVSIFEQGGLNIGEGEMVGGGIRQLEFLDAYYNELANSKSEEDFEEDGDAKVKEEYEAFGMPIALAGILLGSLIMNAILGKWLFNFMLISALG